VNHLNQIQGTTAASSGAASPKLTRPQTACSSSGESFNEALQRADGKSDIKFSNHAQKRLETRQIRLPDDGLARLALAVDKAELRGGQDTLVLMDNLAFIVNVPQRTVVTAMDTQKRGEGVFTQIDTVVLADPSVNPDNHLTTTARSETAGR